MYTYLYINFFVDMELDMEAESINEPLPSQKSTTMDSCRIEVGYRVCNDMHACVYVCSAIYRMNVYNRQLFPVILTCLSTYMMQRMRDGVNSH